MLGTGTSGKLTMLLIGLVAFVAIIALILLLSSLADRLPKGRDRAQLLIFFGPGVVLLVMGMVWPMIRTLYLSVHDGAGDKLVGMENYSWIFTQPDVLTTLKNTAIWVVVAPIVTVSIGLLFAVLVDNKPGEKVAKSLIFIPMAISGVAAAIIWRFVYAYVDPTSGGEQIGLLNQLVIWLGITPPDGGWIPWSGWNTFFLIIVFVWGQVGFSMVLLSAAIKSIPADMVEAARLDGVSAWQMFARITVPTVRPALVTTYMVVLIGTLKTFDIVYTITGGNFDTNVLATAMYFQSFVALESGQGAALAVVLFILVIPAVIFQVRQLRLQRENA